MVVRPLTTSCEGRAFNLRYLNLWLHRTLRHRIRPPAMGEVWVIVDHRYTTSQPSRCQACTTSWRFLAMFKNLVAMPEIVSYNHRATSCDLSLDVMRHRGCLYHIFTCSHVHGHLTMLCHVRATSYDIVRDRTNIVRLYIVFRC